MNTDAMSSTIQRPDAADSQDIEHTRRDRVDPCDYSDGTDSAGRVWKPSSVDELEAALAKAAVDSRLPIGKEWDRFCRAVAQHLGVPGAVPLRSGRHAGDAVPRM